MFSRLAYSVLSSSATVHTVSELVGGPLDYLGTFRFTGLQHVLGILEFNTPKESEQWFSGWEPVEVLPLSHLITWLRSYSSVAPSAPLSCSDQNVGLLWLSECSDSLGLPY